MGFWPHSSVHRGIKHHYCFQGHYFHKNFFVQAFGVGATLMRQNDQASNHDPLWCDYQKSSGPCEQFIYHQQFCQTNYSVHIPAIFSKSHPPMLLFLHNISEPCRKSINCLCLHGQASFKGLFISVTVGHAFSETNISNPGGAPPFPSAPTQSWPPAKDEGIYGYVWPEARSVGSGRAEPHKGYSFSF